jgi:hypothetical protein
LRDQRMLRLGDIMFERDGIATICDPAAHPNDLLEPSKPRGGFVEKRGCF